MVYIADTFFLKEETTKLNIKDEPLFQSGYMAGLNDARLEALELQEYIRRLLIFHYETLLCHDFSDKSFEDEISNKDMEEQMILDDVWNVSQEKLAQQDTLKDDNFDWGYVPQDYNI